MSLSAKSEKTVYDILKELDGIGNRVIMTIPFGSKEEEATGFISIAGENDSFPIFTICVENPITKKSTVSTIVFPSKDLYNSMIEKMLVDYSIKFQGEENVGS